MAKRLDTSTEIFGDPKTCARPIEDKRYFTVSHAERTGRPTAAQRVIEHVVASAK